MPIIKLFNKDNFHSIIGCYIVTSEYPTTKIVVESEGGIDLEHFANYFVQLLEYYIKLDFHKFAYDKDSEEMNLSLMNFVKKLSTYDKLQSSLTNKTTLQKTVKV